MKSPIRQMGVMLAAAMIMAACMAAQAQQAAQNFTGKGISIAILAPTASGLAKNQSYLPALVQGEFVSNFSGYSAISVLDRERLDTINIELISPIYDDSAIAKQARQIGTLAHTTHIMGGNITKTATGYALQMHITKTDDKTAAASYSGTFTFAELDNLTGVRRASLDLLRKMGVALSEKAQEELAGAATESRVNAQTALAKGLTAQREKSEVAALSYYFQAAAFDPSLMEAANRSSKLNANISSGNMGDNIRNDIQWRKDWIARLTETEQFFDNFNKTESMPYTLYYSDDIEQGAVNYQTETVSLGIATLTIANSNWPRPLERALQAVYDGLDATKRKGEWQLSKWPYQGVTNLNAFATREQKFSVVFELLNNQNKVIGRQTLQTGGSWGFGSRRPKVEISSPANNAVNFQNVNANDITDKMTIRIASVNGADAGIAAKNGSLQIRTFIKGVTVGTALKDTRDGKSYRTVVVGNQIWMGENLNYQTGNSKCYGNDASNCAKYGRLYNWNDALSACPVGWHLPSKYEWTILADVVGGSYTAGKKLKSTNGWSNNNGTELANVVGSPPPARKKLKSTNGGSNNNGTDDYGFSALPGGYGNHRDWFNGAGNDGYWWSATEDADNGGAFNRHMNYSDGIIYVVNRYNGKTYLYSVRCVQD